MIKNPYSGKFIAFEGIDGCGKTTQCQKAFEWLSGRGSKALMTKEPAKYLPSGKLIYGLLFGKDKVKFSNMSAVQRQRHYYINRAEHYFHTAIPALQNGMTLLTDRCLVSVVLDVQKPNDLEILLDDEECYFSMSEVPLIRPDKVIIYDLPPDVAVARLAQKDERRRDFFEQPDRIGRARQAYLEFADRFPDFCHIVDGQGSIEDVFLKTKEVIDRPSVPF